ncbi:MAG: hypothetical protein H7301_01825 [Cryobacterium sp.]|nr:hypothetical protein [Oligoflexia bacterium]
MEQDEVVYQYLMGSEVYRFESPSDHEAHHHREYALLHFQEKLGPLFDLSALRGPERVIPTSAFQAEV